MVSKSVGPLSRDRWFESAFLQQGVYREPFRAGGCRLIAAGGKRLTSRRTFPLKSD
jgi:hypothetical protein